MQIIVTWSNGMTSELEVEVPPGVTPIQTSFDPGRPETALHQKDDKSWECYSAKDGGGSIGYCLSPAMVMMMTKCGNPVEGLKWADIWSQPENHFVAAAISRCWWIKEESWERDRRQRLANKEKFHFHGHGTEQEAINCYQEFLKDFGELEPV